MIRFTIPLEPVGQMHDLRQLGYQIEKTMIQVPKRGGGTARVAEYRLVRAKGEVA